MRCLQCKKQRLTQNCRKSSKPHCYGVALILGELRYLKFTKNVNYDTAEATEIAKMAHHLRFQPF
jgi:hypothetical protein